MYHQFVELNDPIDPDFVEKAKQFWDRQGSECKYPPYRSLFMDYHHLSFFQAEAYFHWRSELRQGNILEGFDGYLVLFVAESLALEVPVDEVLESLQEISDSGLFPPIMVSDLAADVCIAWSHPFPDWLKGKPVLLEDFFRSHSLKSPLVFMRDAYEFLGPVMDLHLSGEKLNLALNHALRSIDEHLVNTTGKTLLETYSKGMKTQMYAPLSVYHIPRGREIALEYDELDDSFDQFLAGLIASIDKHFDLGLGLKQKRGFPNEYQSIVRSLADRAGSLSPWIAATAHPLPIREKREEDTDGILFPLKPGRSLTLSPKFKTEIPQFRELVEEKPHPYVPSEGFHSQYRHLNKQQLAFYFYWRTCVRRGRYPGTDLGYLRLYLCEEVNSPEPPEKVFEGMYKAVITYSGKDRSAPELYARGGMAHLRRACIDYAIYYGLTLPKDLPCETLLALTIRFDQFLTGKTEPLSKHMLVGMAKLSPSKAESIDEDMAEIASAVLLRLNSMIHGGFYKQYRVRHETVKYHILEDVQFYGKPAGTKLFQITVPDVYGNPRLREQISDLLQETSIHVKSYLKKGRKKPEPHKCFGVDVMPLLKEETERHFTIVPEPVEVTLDHGLIQSAQEDLNYVSSVMSTEEEEARPTVETAEPKTVGSGWEGFTSVLTEVQREYLRALIKGGNAKDVLGQYGTTANKMADSVNAIAMDCIGDAVLEGSELVEDYIEDISKVL